MNERKAERRGLGRGLSALMADVHLAPEQQGRRRAWGNAGEGGRQGDGCYPTSGLSVFSAPLVAGTLEHQGNLAGEENGSGQKDLTPIFPLSSR